MSTLGIECGGTSSKAVLWNPNTKKFEKYSFGPGNFLLLGTQQLQNLFGSLNDLMLANHEGESIKITKLGIGMPGILTDEHKSEVRKAVSKIWPNLESIWVGNDLETAIECLENEANENVSAIKIVIISGTGSSCFGTNGKESSVAGGGGHIIGSVGSGYYIGHQALRFGMKEYVRNHGESELFSVLLAKLRLETRAQIVQWSLKASVTEIADLATTVIKLWMETGNESCRRIMETSARELALDALALVQKLGSKQNTESISFGFCGSLLTQCEKFSTLLEEQIRSLLPSSNIRFKILNDTVYGAFNRVKMGEDLQSVEPNVNQEPEAINDDEVLRKLILPVATGLSVTETRNPNSMSLHQMSISDSIDLWCKEESSYHSEIRKSSPIIEKLILRVVEAFRNGGRLFYVGAGTSGRLGILDASECPPTFKSPPHWVQGVIAGGQKAIQHPVEGAEDSIIDGMKAIREKGVGPKDIVLGIACSGRTPFVWGSLYQAKLLGAFTAILAFNPNMKFSKFTPDESLIINVGPEILTGSTRLKSGSATKVVLNMITTLAMVQYGKVLENLMVDLMPCNAKLRDRALRITMTILDSTGFEQSDNNKEIVQKLLVKNEYSIKKTVEEIQNKRN